MDKDFVASSEEALAAYGEFFDSQGTRYFRCSNSRVGIKSDKIKAFRGAVEKLTIGDDGWLQVKLQG